MIKSPRQKFLALAKVRSDWEKITETEAFDKACDHALLQMQAMMSSSHELAAASHLSMIGAQTVIRILKTIHEPEEAQVSSKIQSLNYQAGV